MSRFSHENLSLGENNRNLNVHLVTSLVFFSNSISIVVTFVLFRFIRNHLTQSKHL